MSIKLNIEIAPPLSDEDRELLSGIAAMSFAIANQQMMQAAMEDQEEEMEPQPCGAVGRGNDSDKICVSPVGHPGRHKFRLPNQPEVLN